MLRYILALSFAAAIGCDSLVEPSYTNPYDPKTDTGAPIPDVPTDVRLIASELEKITLSWRDNSGIETGYQINILDESDGSQNVWSGAANSTQATIWADQKDRVNRYVVCADVDNRSTNCSDPISVVYAVNVLAEQKPEPWMSPRDVEVMAMRPDGKWLVTSGAFGQITVWDLDSGTIVGTLGSARFFYPTHLEYSLDGSKLAIGGEGHVRILDAESAGEVVLDIGKQIDQLSFSADGRSIAVATNSGVIVYRTSDGEAIVTFENQEEEMSEVQFSPRGDLLVVVSVGEYSRRRIMLVRTSDYRLMGTIDAEIDQARFVLNIRFSPDGHRMAFYEESGSTKNIRVFSISGFDATFLRSLPPTSIFYEFSADGQEILTPFEGRILRWSVQTGALAGSITGIIDGLYLLKPIKRTPDGRRMAAAGPSGNVVVWTPDRWYQVN